MGPIEATAEKEKTIPLPPIVGGAALAGGIPMVFVGAKKISASGAWAVNRSTTRLRVTFTLHLAGEKVSITGQRPELPNKTLLFYKASLQSGEMAPPLLT